MTNFDKKRWREKRRYLLFVKKEKRRLRRYSRDGHHKYIPFSLDNSERAIASYNHRAKAKDVRDGITITLPEEFDFDTNYIESALVIQVFRRALMQQKKIAYIDFSHMKRISPACILVLASYADLWKRKNPKVHARVDTWHPGIADVFAQMGFFELLSLKKPDLTSPNVEIAYLPFTRGVVENVDYAGALANQFCSSIENEFGVSIRKNELYDGVTEAITNVIHHAYTHLSDAAEKTNIWWASVAYEKSRQKLSVMFFDHGQGIPKTLKYSKHFTRIAGTSLMPKSHGKLIQIAFELGRQRSVRPGRGRGLFDLLKFPLHSAEGNIKIRSCNGRYVREYTRGVSERRGDALDTPIKLRGTLIEWSVTL